MGRFAVAPILIGCLSVIRRIPATVRGGKVKISASYTIDSLSNERRSRRNRAGVDLRFVSIRRPYFLYSPHLALLICGPRSTV
ncbi:hypothetical protein MES4922_10161 [Mesorhizobium ventifaucium]|uniref:Secreted protein n=1 Tax=Mesorhizobium ventifaucium TaxID=666020 RepID=A0ABM9DCK2_9HYPH|nr:hypothetical protein MES4922_10161 [Mesorhizobium ventifaucium]